MLILCPVFVGPLFLEVGYITVPLPQRKFPNDFEFSLENWVALLAELLSKCFDTLNFKI